ncbi:hypothetical protein OTB20_19405 [Streptomyces sp. H27-H1]|uniref:hypothetical protein n=1 Tax=Streptomyces sp. H27-H1 TaxID=2996461 RepID=UPI002271CE45|nr:hypothetical protein [Streptomyces sp. H27-H1]MCY0928324.1 hypothetical protein [Streptomyces sp. H27-H1]
MAELGGYLDGTAVYLYACEFHVVKHDQDVGARGVRTVDLVGVGYPIADILVCPFRQLPYVSNHALILLLGTDIEFSCSVARRPGTLCA